MSFIFLVVLAYAEGRTYKEDTTLNISCSNSLVAISFGDISWVKSRVMDRAFEGDKNVRKKMALAASQQPPQVVHTDKYLIK